MPQKPTPQSQTPKKTRVRAKHANRMETITYGPRPAGLAGTAQAHKDIALIASLAPGQAITIISGKKPARGTVIAATPNGETAIVAKVFASGKTSKPFKAHASAIRTKK